MPTRTATSLYLAHPAVWYTAEGGISALDIMLQDLESELLGLTLFQMEYYGLSPKNSYIVFIELDC